MSTDKKQLVLLINHLLAHAAVNTRLLLFSGEAVLLLKSSSAAHKQHMLTAITVTLEADSTLSLYSRCWQK